MKQLFTIFILLFVVGDLLAAPKEYKIRLNGKPVSKKVFVKDKKAIFWTTSNGNSSSALNISLRAPKGVKLKVKARHYKGSPRKSLSKKRGWYKVLIKNQAEFDAQQLTCSDISFGEEEQVVSDEVDIANFPALQHPVCDELGQEVLTAIAEQLSITYGGDWGVGNACSYIVNYYEGGLEDGELLPGLNEILPEDPEANTQNRISRFFKTKKLYGLFHKNACLDARNSKYLIKFIVDVSKVKPKVDSYFPTVSLTVREERPYPGVKASSIKPVSEGRHAPSPLIMMNWLGSNCGEVINLVKWKKTKVKRKTVLPIYVHLYYRDLILALANAEKVLTGGEGTFELYNGVHAYGVCFDLERRRQRAFGYPGG